jgi:hypothetical protein
MIALGILEKQLTNDMTHNKPIYFVGLERKSYNHNSRYHCENNDDSTNFGLYRGNDLFQRGTR